MKTAFVFGAQGTQWPGMGRDLLRESPDFADAIDTCDAGFVSYSGWSIRAELEADPRAQRHPHDPGRAQPTLTALQIALAAMVLAEGTEPYVTAGLSMGEAAAAWCSGVLDRAQAMRIAWATARLADDAGVIGAMAFLRASDRETTRLVATAAGQAWRAVELGGSTTIIAGTRPGISTILDTARATGTPCAPIALPQPYHTPLVEALRGQFVADIAGVIPQEPRVPFSSSVVGAQRADNTADREHWWRVCRRPANWPATVRTLLDTGARQFIEIGPHPMLLSAVGEIANGLGVEVELRSAMQRTPAKRTSASAS